MHNILLLTTGSANSTITAKMLAKLGWNLNDADDEFAESVEARRINTAMLKTGMFNTMAAAKHLTGLRQPWVMKDPRFAHTLRHWMPLLATYRPMLLYITKDLDYVKASIKRRFGMPAEIADKRAKWCSDYFSSWPYAKWQVDASQISAAVALFDPARSFAHCPTISTGKPLKSP